MDDNKNLVTEIDIAPSDDIMTTSEQSVASTPTQPKAAAPAPAPVVDTSKWIEIVEGKFTCAECENSVAPETNSIEGVVVADLEEIKADLAQYPTKVVYGSCPVCGMEYIFRHQEGKLFLEKSDMEK